MRLFTSLLLSGSLLTLVAAQTVVYSAFSATASIRAAQPTQQVSFLYQAKRVEHRGSGRRSLAIYANSQLG